MQGQGVVVVEVEIFSEDGQALKQEPGKAVEPPSLEVSQSQLDKDLSNMV